MAKKPHLLADLMKSVGNEFASIAETGIVAGDITGYIDTGSYSFNALLSGSLFKGLASNKILGLAGEESTGKTFYALSIAKNFLGTGDSNFIANFITESDFGKETLENRGIDTSRFLVFPIETVEEFRTQCMKMVENLNELGDGRPQGLFILDSMGNLSTVKEITDISKGDNKRDMTKQQLLRGAFRALTLKLGKLQVPMIVVNHTYEVVGAYIPTKEMCLIEGTLVATPTGDTAIEKLKLNDTVHTLMGPQKIVDTHLYNSSDLIEIQFEDDTVITCTANHKFLVNGQWVSASDLLALVQNTEILNIDLSSIDGPTDVFRKQIHENLYEYNE